MDLVRLQGSPNLLLKNKGSEVVSGVRSPIATGAYIHVCLTTKVHVPTYRQVSGRRKSNATSNHRMDTKVYKYPFHPTHSLVH